MADNFPLTPGSGRNAATDQVTFSGDTADVQLMRPVLVTGAEGSKTVVDLPGDNTNGLDVDVTRVSGNVTVVQSTAANLNATVSGTVTGNQGTAAATASAWPVKVTDGTNVGAVKAASTAAQATDPSAVVALSPNSPLPTGSNTIGALTANQSVNLAQVGGTNTVTGGVNGSQGVGGLAASGATLAGNPVLVAGSDGTNARSLSVATDGHLVVDVMGSRAHDATDADEPVKIGGRARSTVITSVASDDRTDGIYTLQGYGVQHPYALPQSALTGTASSTGTGDTAVIVAQGAGVTINVTTIIIHNDSNTNTFVNIKDGATTRLVVPAPGKGGASITLPFPLRLTANTALNFASGSGVTTMYVSAVAFAGI